MARERVTLANGPKALGSAPGPILKLLRTYSFFIGFRGEHNGSRCSRCWLTPPGLCWVMGKKPGACASVLDGLSVRAPRTITIFDWRLFCLHKLLVVLILGYVVLQADYLAETVHTGVFAVWAEAYETSDRYFGAGGWCAGGAPCDRGVATVSSYATRSSSSTTRGRARASSTRCAAATPTTRSSTAPRGLRAVQLHVPASGEVVQDAELDVHHDVAPRRPSAAASRRRAPRRTPRGARPSSPRAARRARRRGRGDRGRVPCSGRATRSTSAPSTSRSACSTASRPSSPSASTRAPRSCRAPSCAARTARPKPGPWYRPGTDGADCNVREFKAGELLTLTVVDLLDMFGLTLDAGRHLHHPFGSPDNAVGGCAPRSGSRASSS